MWSCDTFHPMSGVCIDPPPMKIGFDGRWTECDFLRFSRSSWEANKLKFKRSFESLKLTLWGFVFRCCQSWGICREDFVVQRLAWWWVRAELFFRLPPQDYGKFQLPSGWRCTRSHSQCHWWRSLSCWWCWSPPLRLRKGLEKGLCNGGWISLDGLTRELVSLV